MNEFVKRNMPIFVIGFATLVIFIGIIILAQKSGSVGGPELKKIEDVDLVAPHTQFFGNPQAAVVLIEFSDFGCPACKSIHPIVKSIAAQHENLTLGFRHFPLPQSKNSREAAVAAQAAAIQGKFWEYVDKLFENQPNFEEEDLINYASELELDIEKFKTDIKNQTFSDQVSEDLRIAKKLRLNSTPTFILNNEIMRFRTLDDFRNKINEKLSEVGATSEVINQTNQENGTQEGTNNSVFDTQDEKYKDVDLTYGLLDISYGQFGFEPGHNKIQVGQKVRWTNGTKDPMKLEQIIRSYSELDSPVQINPGDTFEFRMYKEGLWTYKEADHRHYGSVFVLGPEGEVEGAGTTSESTSSEQGS